MELQYWAFEQEIALANEFDTREFARDILERVQAAFPDPRQMVARAWILAGTRLLEFARIPLNEDVRVKKVMEELVSLAGRLSAQALAVCDYSSINPGQDHRLPPEVQGAEGILSVMVRIPGSAQPSWMKSAFYRQGGENMRLLGEIEDPDVWDNIFPPWFAESASA